LSYIGLTWNLKQFNHDLFEKGKIQMQEKALLLKKNKYDWGIGFDDLPTITQGKFDQLIRENEKLIIINQRVVDVKSFVNEHPGGSNFIQSFIGKDATKEFTGVIYNHSNCAINMLSNLSKYKLLIE
jgi:stearoyl-CoA desaturase (Delta-9 desaturase)